MRPPDAPGCGQGQVHAPADLLSLSDQQAPLLLVMDDLTYVRCRHCHMQNSMDGPGKAAGLVSL